MSPFNIERNWLGRHIAAAAPYRVTRVVGGGILLLVLLLFVACGDDNDNSNAANNAPNPQATATNSSAPVNQAASNGPKSEEGSIEATPNPVPAGPGSGKTKITWKTKGNLGVVKVY